MAFTLRIPSELSVPVLAAIALYAREAGLNMVEYGWMLVQGWQWDARLPAAGSSLCHNIDPGPCIEEDNAKICKDEQGAAPTPVSLSHIKIHSRFKLQGPEEHLYASPPALWQATRSSANKSSATHLHKSEIATKRQYVFCAVVNSVGVEFGYAWVLFVYYIFDCICIYLWSNKQLSSFAAGWSLTDWFSTPLHTVTTMTTIKSLLGYAIAASQVILGPHPCHRPKSAEAEPQVPKATPSPIGATGPDPTGPSCKEMAVQARWLTWLGQHNDRCLWFMNMSWYVRMLCEFICYDMLGCFVVRPQFSQTYHPRESAG